MTRIYICGPMTGYPEMNSPAFHAAADALRAAGHEAVNPAELNPEPGKAWADCMRVDIAALMTCEAVALLPGYEHSRGAMVEARLAGGLGIPVHGLRNFLPAENEVTA